MPRKNCEKVSLIDYEVEPLSLPQCYRLVTAAKLLDSSVQTIEQWIKDGILRATKVNRTVLIRHCDIIDFLNSGAIGPSHKQPHERQTPGAAAGNSQVSIPTSCRRPTPSLDPNGFKTKGNGKGSGRVGRPRRAERVV